MKHFMTCMMLLCSSASFAANSLIKSPTTGAIPDQHRINAMTMVWNNTDAALVLGNTGAVYVLDIADANTADAAANTITSVASFGTSKLNAVAGKPVTVIDMVVNPRSRSVYILGRTIGTTNYAFHVFKVTNAGKTVTMLNLNNISYARVNVTKDYQVSSLAFGDGTLYASASKASLTAELDYMKAPFGHDANFAKQQTSMFKSNWGTSYVTSAPLEKMAYGTVRNTKRLAGVTTCAPGFSLDLSKVRGTGNVQVTEDFDLNSGLPAKVMLLNHDGKSWLYELHDNWRGNGVLHRIGEKYLDGSQVAANKYNTTSQKLRALNGSITTGLGDADLKVIGNYAGVATWNEGQLLVLEPEADGGTLKIITVGTVPTPTGIQQVTTLPLSLAPNPARQSVSIQLPAGMQSGTAVITAMDGRVLRHETLTRSNNTLQLTGLPTGNYGVRVSDGAQQAAATLQVQ